MRRKRSARGSVPVASLHDSPHDRFVRRLLLTRLLRLRERLEVRLHAGDLRHRGADRRLELLGDLVRLLEREVAGQLHVQRQLLVPVDIDQREVVHLADARHADRGRVRALAQVAFSIGST